MQKNHQSSQPIQMSSQSPKIPQNFQENKPLHESDTVQHSQSPQVSQRSQSDITIQDINLEDPNFFKKIQYLSQAQKYLIVAKVCSLIVLYLMIITAQSSYKLISKNHKPECLWDRYHTVLKDLNEAINDKSHKIMRDGLQITSSLMMDFSALLIFSIWARTSNNMRLLFQTLLFYSSRALVQANFKFRFQEGGYWEDPGLTSLTVPYGRTTDFYFSGHCGFLTIMAVEMSFMGYKRSMVVPILTVIFMAFVLVAFRTHYSIDIPIGILWAIQCCLISFALTPYMHSFLQEKVLGWAIFSKVVTYMPKNEVAQSERQQQKSRSRQKQAEAPQMVAEVPADQDLTKNAAQEEENADYSYDEFQN